MSYSVKATFGPERFLQPEHLPYAVVVPMRISGVNLVESSEGRFLEIEFRTRYGNLRATKPMAEQIAAILGSDDTADWIARELGVFRSVDHLPAGYSPCIRVCDAKQAKQEK